jgi:hypothetical protein|tara:strand:- start:1014 stop:1262 length:249 start_codon:yes stop_codon:yes gene_type:complete
MVFLALYRSKMVMEQLDDRAFRRGYRHGYNQAHDDITRFKFKNSKILKMINHYLLEWNFVEDAKKMIFPPTIQGLKQKGEMK